MRCGNRRTLLFCLSSDNRNELGRRVDTRIAPAFSRGQPSNQGACSTCTKAVHHCSRPSLRFPSVCPLPASPCPPPRASATRLSPAVLLIFLRNNAQTFVGAKAVRLLLTNRDMRGNWHGPIMCVCLTNHALDQFLCDLLDAGVQGIVR